MGKKTKIGLTAVAVGAAAWAGSKALANPQARPEKKVLSYDKPVVLAHKGGAALAPESSMAAFRKAAELGVHGFEIDIRLTKDEEIVVFHDEFIDATTESSGKVADLTIGQLRNFDIGHHFIDLDGNHSFRGKGERIVLLKELLEEFPEMYINIDMKDRADTYEGSLIPSKLWRLLDENGAHDRVVVTSFHDEQIDRFNLYAQDRIALGAGENEVKKAYSAFNSQFGHLYQPRADVFQIPVRASVFRLDSARFVSFLASLRIPVHYWTVNDPEMMKRLIEIGAKGIVTDRPDLALEILNGQ